MKEKRLRIEIEKDYLKLQQLTDLERMHDNMVRHKGALWITKINNSEIPIRHDETRNRLRDFVYAEIRILKTELGLIDPYPAPEFEEAD